MRIRWTLPAVLALLGLAVASPAQAGVLVSSATNCATETLEQPFLRWADSASYSLAPGGNFEAGAAGWALRGAAVVKSGNEPFYAHAAGESSSLALPAGSSATSPAVCVSLDHPTLRLFVRNGGSFLSALKVDVLFESSTGQVLSAPIAVVPGGAWAPSLPIPIVANLLPLLPNEQTAVSFRFTPVLGGDWRIDDVYVDPWNRR
jgi:hypothetical protein